MGSIVAFQRRACVCINIASFLFSCRKLLRIYVIRKTNTHTHTHLQLKISFYEIFDDLSGRDKEREREREARKVVV